MGKLLFSLFVFLGLTGAALAQPYTLTPGFLWGLNGAQQPIPPLYGTQYFNVTATTTSLTPLITPAAGSRWFLSEIYCTELANTVFGTAGYETVTLRDGPSNIIFSSSVYINTTAGTSTTPIILFPPGNDMQIISATAGNPLNLGLSASTSAGGVNCTAIGGTTTYTQ